MVRFGWSDFMGTVASRVRFANQLSIARGELISEETSRNCCRRVLRLQGQTSKSIPSFDNLTPGVSRWPGGGVKVSKLYVGLREAQLWDMIRMVVQATPA